MSMKDSLEVKMIKNAITLIDTYPDTAKIILKDTLDILPIKTEKINYTDRLFSFILGLMFGVVICLFISLL